MQSKSSVSNGISTNTMSIFTPINFISSSTYSRYPQFLYYLLLLLGLLLSSTLLAFDKHILLLKKLGKLAVLVHRDDNVATADELLVDVELGNGGPVAVLLDTCMMRATVSTAVFCLFVCFPFFPLPLLSFPFEPLLYIPCLNSESSNTLKAANLLGSTPCRPRTWMLAREKPHWGVSGVPFMKRTTGAEATALSMAWRVASDNQRFW